VVSRGPLRGSRGMEKWGRQGKREMLGRIAPWLLGINTPAYCDFYSVSTEPKKREPFMFHGLSQPASHVNTDS